MNNCTCDVPEYPGGAGGDGKIICRRCRGLIGHTICGHERKEYEYKYFYDNAETLINQRSKEGWEFIAFDNNVGRALYKRQQCH